MNCCNPQLNGGGGWGIFNALFGWQNSATYGSVISYNLYWLAVILVFSSMRFKEAKGHWPLMKAKVQETSESVSASRGLVSGPVEETKVEKKADRDEAPTVSRVHEIAV